MTTEDPDKQEDEDQHILRTQLNAGMGTVIAGKERLEAWGEGVEEYARQWKNRQKARAIMFTGPVQELIPRSLSGKMWSTILIVLILLFTVYSICFVPLLFGAGDDITPEGESHSVEVRIGDGGHSGNVYQSDEEEDSSFEYQEKLFIDCSPSDQVLSTGGKFECEYSIKSVRHGTPGELVQFSDEFLSNRASQPFLIGEWKGVSPNGESSYVTNTYPLTDRNTIEGTFDVYTPADPGEYEFRLLVDRNLNPIGPEHPESDTVYTSPIEVYVYSEAESAAFTYREATFQLERVAIIAIWIGFLQLIFSTHSKIKGN